MRVFDAIWAFRYHGVLPQHLEGAIFGHSLTTYGWVWLIVAAVYFIGAWLIFAGSQVGRWFGVVAAAIGALSAIWWMPYYPVWSLVYIGLAGFVIYALIVHASERETTSYTERVPTPPTPVAG